MSEIDLSKATPRPWHTGKANPHVIYADTMSEAARCRTNDDAELVVRAVNSFEAMRDALAQWMCPSCGGTGRYNGYSHNAPDGGPCRKCVAPRHVHPIAEAALKLAEGK